MNGQELKVDLKQRYRVTSALFRRELSSFFQTPIAYVVGVIFLAVSAFLFFSVFFVYDRAEMRQFFGSLPLFMALVIPSLSMKLVAEERRRGTWEILSTLPVRNGEVVVAKFLAVWVTGLFFLLPTFFFAFTISIFGDLDLGPVFGGYLGAALLISAYAAIGVFSSSVARNETVALFTALVISLFFVLLQGFIVIVPTALVPLMEYLGITNHFNSFARGLIDSRSVVYLISLSVSFLILARYRLDRLR